MGLFYGGLVRSKHSLSSMLKCLVVLGPCSLVWVSIGDSMVFGDSYLGIIGNFNNLFLKKIYLKPAELLASLFQMMFALLSVSVMVGAVVERISFRFWIVFGVVWSLFVYYPVAHWVWADQGWLRQLGAIDFAGGVVVHISTGCSALILALKLGRRVDFFQLKKNYNLGMLVVGTTFLALGWMGFNGGSSAGFNSAGVYAIINSILSITGGLCSWLLVDYIFTPHKISTKGVCIAIICSLVGITPAAGHVTIYSALLIGFITCFICNLGVRYFHSIFKIDDPCEVFISHGVGGIVGALLTGLFASSSVNISLGDSHNYFSANLISSVIVAIYSMAMTAIIIFILEKFMTFRISRDIEIKGLDVSLHGEDVIVIEHNL